MRIPHMIALACCANLASALQSDSAPVMRDVATHQQLARALGESRAVDPMTRMQVATGEDPSKAARPADLISQSEIICFNGVATLVPKRAVLATPENMRERLAVTAGARIVGWSEFYAANRGWITTEEVSFPQAEGKQPLSEASAKRLSKTTNLVVATFHGGPISVMAPAAVAPVPENQR